MATEESEDQGPRTRLSKFINSMKLFLCVGRVWSEEDGYYLRFDWTAPLLKLWHFLIFDKTRAALKRLWESVKQVRRELNYALVISLVLILCIELWWKHIPPMFGWRDAYEMAELAKDFLLAVIASYVFFFIGDHWETAERRARMMHAVRGRLEDIMRAYSPVVNFLNERGKDKPWMPSNPLYMGYDEIGHVLIQECDGAETTRRFLMRWLDHGEEVHRAAGIIVDQFGDFDHILNALLDEIRRKYEALARLHKNRDWKSTYREFTREEMESIHHSEHAYNKELLYISKINRHMRDIAAYLNKNFEFWDTGHEALWSVHSMLREARASRSSYL